MSKTGYLQVTAFALLLPLGLDAASACAEESVLAKDNLVAWCIVPFDAKQRGPEERAEMLETLGITRLAYDWRENHISTFEEEILEMKKHDIEFFAFWGVHGDFIELVKKYGIKPQFWMMIPVPAQGSQKEKVEAAAKHLMPVVEQMRELGCKIALYNHGGWGGEPANMAAVVKWLRENATADHVGIVYNLHHGHGHINDFAQALATMKPYLFCLNLNGMNANAQPKILPIGQGQHEATMMKIIQQSGYDGPIGILDHRADVDSEEALRANLEGMRQALKQLDDQAALKTYN